MSGSRPPRAVLFDALGTLLELEPPAPRLRAELAERHGVEVSLAQAQAAIAREIAYYRAHLDEGRDPGALADLRRRCAETLRDALPVARERLPDATVLLDTLLASLSFRAYPDAATALDRARASGSRTVVVSNWDVSLHDVLERAGLAARLDAVLTSAEAGARKPDPAIFDLALRAAGVPASDAVHVGDSLEEDVAGARAAGISAVLIRRDGAPGPPGVRTIAGLAELG